MPKDNEWVELSVAIQVLRDQLLLAKETGIGADLHFEVGKVEVELELEARRTGGGEGGIQFGVFTLRGKGEISSGSTNRLKLELLPRNKVGGSLEIKGNVDELPSR